MTGLRRGDGERADTPSGGDKKIHESVRAGFILLRTAKGRMNETDLAGVLRQFLASGEAADLDRFIRLAQPVVAAGVLRIARRMGQADRSFADDMIQETFLKVCAADFRVLRDFRASDANALEVYLKTIAASVVVDQIRTGSTQKKGSGKTAASLDEVAWGLAADDGHLAELERAQMLQRIDRCLDTQAPRNRTIFWLYHRQGLKPRTISALPGMDVGSDGVETIVYRLTRTVRECLRRAGLLQPAAIREGGRARIASLHGRCPLSELESGHLSAAQIMAAAAGELNDSAPDAHLQACAECRREVQEWRETAAELAPIRERGDRAATEECPHPEELANYCAGAGGEESARLLAHLAQCGRCAVIAAEGREADPFAAPPMLRTSTAAWRRELVARVAKKRARPPYLTYASPPRSQSPWRAVRCGGMRGARRTRRRFWRQPIRPRAPSNTGCPTTATGRFGRRAEQVRRSTAPRRSRTRKRRYSGG